MNKVDWCCCPALVSCSSCMHMLGLHMTASCDF
jgi:hypothetical protein